MALTYWWLLPPGLVGLAVVVLFVVRRAHGTDNLVPLAHSDRLTSLPSYRKAVAKQRRWTAVGLASCLLLAGSALVAAARPVHTDTSVPEEYNRDIVLCLDVSGSMTEIDQAVVAVFAELAQGFKGERIGLTIFDSTAVQVFPLTDDYAYASEQLKVAAKGLARNSQDFDFLDGTYGVPGSSLIGDGLASCVGAFPHEKGPQRSRSIVMATDNMLAGSPVFKLSEATTLAKKAGVHVHALNPNDYGAGNYVDPAAQGLMAAATSTGGSYHALDLDAAVNPDTVKSIVKVVEDTEAARLKGAPVRTLSDQPALPLGLALVSLAGLGLTAWKVRR